MQITIDTYKLAKEKGFKGTCELDVIPDKDVKLPTQSDLQKWLREGYNIDISIAPYCQIDYETEEVEKKYTARVDNWDKTLSIHESTGLIMPDHYHYEGDNYEKVFEESLQEGLKLIKE